MNSFICQAFLEAVFGMDIENFYIVIQSKSYLNFASISLAP